MSGYPSSAPKAGWRGLVIAAGVLLASAVTVQFFSRSGGISVPRAESLAAYFPVAAGDWHGFDVPLGDTEAVAEAVESELRYDEAVQRSYRKRDAEFTVYVAYWAPGKMPAREVARHIPDVCWPAAGWKRREADLAYLWPEQGLRLKPGQFRRFEHKDSRAVLQVVYWHLYKGQVILYNPLGPPGDLSLLTDLFDKGLGQRGEQYFIRVSSATPLVRLAEDSGFRQVLSRIAGLGLGDRPGSEPADNLASKNSP